MVTPPWQKQFVLADPEKFAQQILEQNSRSLERRCPIAHASNEVVEILSEHWQVFAPGCECLPLLWDGSLLKANRRFDLNYLSTILSQLLQSSQPRHAVLHPYVE